MSSPSDVQPAPDLLLDSGGSLLSLVPVVPVVVLDDLDHAVPVARALVAGGLPVIELTLRTPVALDAIAAIAAEVPEILVGAGTITSPELVSRAVKAGAQFLVSPGTTPGLLREMAWSGVPFLPGTATVSEAHGRARGGLLGDEVLPGRGLRRGGVPEVAGLAAARRPGSARPVASPPPARRRTSPCPTSAASAARG